MNLECPERGRAEWCGQETRKDKFEAKENIDRKPQERREVTLNRNKCGWRDILSSLTKANLWGELDSENGKTR